MLNEKALKELDLTDEQIKAVQKAHSEAITGNYIPFDTYMADQKKTKEAEKKVSELQEQLKEVTELTDKVSELETSLKLANKKARDEAKRADKAGEEFARNSALKEYLTGKVHPAAVDKIMDRYKDKIFDFEFEDGKISFEAEFNTIAEQEPYMVIDQSATGKQNNGTDGKNETGAKGETGKPSSLKFNVFDPAAGAKFDTGAKNPTDAGKSAESSTDMLKTMADFGYRKEQLDKQSEVAQRLFGKKGE